MIKKLFLSLSATALLVHAGNIENELGIDLGATSLHNKKGSEFKNLSAVVTYQLSRYVVSPRFDLEYVNVNDYDGVNSLIKASVNGVYEFENQTNYLPYILGGVGYEQVSPTLAKEFESHPFVQAGAGLAYKLQEGNKIRLEGKFLQILGGNKGEENEAILLAGLSFPLHTEDEPKPKVIERVVRVPQPARPIVVQEEVKVPVYIDNNTCPQKIAGPDKDRDGVEDFRDQCPNTPCDFTVDQFGCPVKATLHINFKTGSAIIEEYSMEKVLNFANFLLRNKGSIVQIVGHTDNVGSNATNMSLSERRARSVADKLSEYGVSPSRITTIGMGENSPIASNATVEGKAQNRRIEAILSYPNSKR